MHRHRLHRLGSVNETWLHGRARHLRVTGVVFTLAAFGLADLPPFATFLGKGWIDDSTWVHGLLGSCPCSSSARSWSAEPCCGSRAGCSTAWVTRRARIPQMAGMAAEETSETDSDKQRTPLTMIVPPAPCWSSRPSPSGCMPRTRLGGPGGRGAASRTKRGYNATVLAGAHLLHPAALAAAEPTGITLSAVLVGLGCAIGSGALAFAALYWCRLPLLRRGYEPGAGLVRAHSAVPERGGE